MPWAFLSILLFGSSFDYDGNSVCNLNLTVGTLLFETGCLIRHKRVICKERLTDYNSVGTYIVNYKTLQIITSLQMIFTLILFLSFFKTILFNYNQNIFVSYLSRQGNSVMDSIIGYGRNFTLAIGLCVIIGCRLIDTKDDLRIKRILFLQLCMYIFNTITRLTRNGVLFSALPLFIVYLIVTRQSNRKVMVKLFTAVVVFIAFFCLISVWKYWYMFENGDFLKLLLDQFRVYGSGGIVAFQKTYDSISTSMYYGGNMFRFILAVIDKFLGTSFAPELVQSFTSIGHNIVTNVFTFYYYYTSDFGALFALGIQFVIGVFHGFQYRQMCKMKMWNIYLYSIFVYPLFMQFFQDQYFSLVSTWIQYLLIGFLILKTDILFRCEKTDEKASCIGYIKKDWRSVRETVLPVMISGSHGLTYVKK